MLFLDDVEFLLRLHNDIASRKIFFGMMFGILALMIVSYLAVCLYDYIKSNKTKVDDK